MADWSERVDELLFEGETVRTSVDVGGGTIVATSHRVLAFTPGDDGPNYRAIDRPNVVGVERRAVSPYDLRATAAKVGIGAVLFVGLGLVVDPEALIPRPDLSSAEGVGGMVGPVQTMLDAFYALDEVALVVGALLAIVAAGLLSVQLAARSERLAIAIAGEDDVVLAFGVDDATLAELRQAIDGPDVTTARSPESEGVPRGDP